MIPSTQMSDMGFVKQKMFNFKGAIKGTESKKNLSLKTLSVLLLGTSGCCQDSSNSSSAQMMYVLTPASVTELI